MKYLVVGASGFIGDRALEYLKNAGHEVIGTRSAADDARLVHFDLQSDRIAECLPAGFFSDGSSVCALVLAGICQIDRCGNERELSRLVNVEKTIVLIDDLTRLGAKVVFFSSSCVHDGRLGYYTDSQPATPINEYGRQKAEVEAYLRDNLPDALVIRLDKVVGDDPTRSHLFSQWSGWIEAGKPITCIADQTLSPTFSTDVVRAAELGCQTGLAGVYNVANAEFFEREELARQFAIACGGDVSIVSKSLAEFPFDEARPLKTYLDGSRFTRATGMRFTPMREVFTSFLEKTGRK